MKVNLNKIRKLLCYLIISLFIMGIGGEKVFAATINRKSGLQNSTNSKYVRNDGLLDFRNGVNSTGNAYFIFEVDGGDAYCLDSKLSAPQNGTTLVEIPNALSDYQKRIAGAVIKASNDNASMIPDKAERFYVTQAILWELIGDGPYNAGQGSPFTINLQNWIHSNYSGFYSAIKEQVANIKDIKQENEIRTNSEEINIEGNTTLTLNTTTNRMESETMTVTSSVQDNIKLTITNGIIEYNGTQYNSTVTVPTGATIKVTAEKPAEGSTVRTSIHAEVNETYTSPSIITYGITSTSGFQKIAVLKNENFTKKYTTEKVFSGTIEAPTQPETPTERSIKFKKIDATTNAPLAGATLKLYKVVESNEVLVSRFLTTESETTIEHLGVGTYKVVETSVPAGYILEPDISKRTVTFSIVQEGNELVAKDANNQTISESTIVLKNTPIRIRIRKVDQNENPVAGVKIYLQEATIFGASLDPERESSFYGITDSNGILKKCTTKACTSHDESGNGVYKVGTDIPAANGAGGSGIYTVYEVDDTKEFDFKAFNLSGLNAQLRFDDSGINIAAHQDPTVVNSTWGFGLYRNEDIRIFNNKIKKLNLTTEDGLTYYDLEIKNYKMISIGKSDITTGEEIAGAKLTITDPTHTGEYLNNNPKNYVDSWTSEAGKKHQVSGIEYGHKYRLTEEIAPEGYYKMETSIDFIAYEDGTVKTFDPVTGNELNDIKGTNYDLLIPNKSIKTLFVSKTSFVTGEEIAGAELKICTKESYDSSNNDCVAKWSWTSGEDGKDENGKIKPHKIEGMEAGTYYLIETTAPAGYIKQTKAVQFEFTNNESTQRVEFKNEPTKVTIQKLDLVTKKRIAGATLQILNAADRTIAKDANGTELTWISREDADWEIYALPAGDYILIEKITPQDYKEGMIINDITTNEYAFTVSDQEGDLNIKVGIEVLNAPNTGISTLNLFAIGGLLVFAGYETIKIYRKKTING